MCEKGTYHFLEKNNVQHGKKTKLFKAQNFVEKREGLKQTKFMTYMPFDGESYVNYEGSFALIGLTMTTSSLAAFY